jgi:hypothetical protein
MAIDCSSKAIYYVFGLDDRRLGHIGLELLDASVSCFRVNTTPQAARYSIINNADIKRISRLDPGINEVDITNIPYKRMQ